jgi:hypothetical protein
MRPSNLDNVSLDQLAIGCGESCAYLVPFLSIIMILYMSAIVLARFSHFWVWRSD